MRLSWSVPYNCKTALVEKYFASEFLSLRKQIYSRYPGFIKKLLNSPSYEIRFLSDVVLTDQRSVVCRNLKHLNKVSGLQDVLIEPKYRLKEAMPFQSDEEIEPWRISLLTKFLEIRMNIMNNLYADFNITKNQVKSVIDSLCV